jgi:D-alanyl-D-alanine carboxypeptidase
MGVQGETVVWGTCGKVNGMQFLVARVLKPVVVFLVALGLALPVSLPAQARGKFASVVVDARTGAIISADDADGRRYPASLTKMMTLYLVFQDLKARRIKLSTPLKVSRRAASMSPSKLYLKPGSTITVEQAIKALVIKSANDAAATVAENLGGGSETAFANRMTRVARQIGMSRSQFKNASGLPNPGQYTTARDMATLGLRLMRDFPQYYPYFRSTSFVFKGRVIRGHNRLVGRFSGTDGIKTGYINASGYNLVTSTRRDDKRVVGVVIGARSSGSRNAHMMTIISRALHKARPGNTVAAVAGSSKGIINPIAKAAPTLEVAKVEEPLPEKDKDLLAAVAAEAAIDSKEEEGDSASALAEEEASASEEPQVLEAKLEEPAESPNKDPKKLPFAVKPAAKKSDDLTVASLPEGYTVQISSFKSKSDAQTGLSNVRAAMGQGAMKNKDAYTIAVKKGGKVSYKVMISGFSAATAKKSCVQASRMGKACTVINPQG